MPATCAVAGNVLTGDSFKTVQRNKHRQTHVALASPGRFNQDFIVRIRQTTVRKDVEASRSLHAAETSVITPAEVEECFVVAVVQGRQWLGLVPGLWGTVDAETPPSDDLRGQPSGTRRACLQFHAGLRCRVGPRMPSTRAGHWVGLHSRHRGPVDTGMVMYGRFLTDMMCVYTTSFP